jgi:hypothetical protein
MSSSFYLQRTLTSHENSYSESGLLAASRYIVVLGEPGGGKTELMSSLADQLGSVVVTANVFGQVGAKAENSPLVIDAFDELAKVDETGIHKLLGNAHKAHPTHVVVSSRSSEWDNAATSSFEDFLGHAPLVVRLREFDEAEQRSIFKHHTPGEDFAAFQTEVTRFDLEALLPNPQFLKLFADAYVESGRHFTNKRSIFEKAVERLTKEANPKVAKSKRTLPREKIVQFASEVFAKLLLSGAEGIGTSEEIEANGNRMYPLLTALFEHENSVENILATRLFKPGDNANQHRPVHKIVAEYCAADYLTKRIANLSDPLTISKCLPIIAPNSTVRDELRGVLGWMASLGNIQVQEATIALDPYAVLANGDPSQLEASSKRLLVSRLKDIADQDPYFRRGDFWRRFSVAGFFTQEVVDEIKPLLTQTGDGHLRDLILELLVGSPAVSTLRLELRLLLLSGKASNNSRVLAGRCLLELKGYDHLPNLAPLIFEASKTSLSVASKIIEELNPVTFSRQYLAGFFRVCATLYPKRKQRPERTIGTRFFVGHLINKLDLPTTEWLLDDLTQDLSCRCGQQAHDCDCDCRNGISKITGAMLNRYFDLASPPHDANRFWQWMKNLNFYSAASPDYAPSVKEIRNDDTLRQGIMKAALGAETDRDIIREIRFEQFEWQSHSGLHFQPQDWRFMADLAFANDNRTLWSSFIATHNHHLKPEERGSNELRRHMRKQASEKPDFLREWASRNRAYDTMMREHREKKYWFQRRRRKREKAIEEANSTSLKRDKELIESGQHWGWLRRIANLYLLSPEELADELGNGIDAELALRNCLSFLEPSVPALEDIALGNWHTFVRVLYAASLTIYRAQGALDGVAKKVLEAVKTDSGGYNGVSQDEASDFETEIDRVIFGSSEELEGFLTRYVEPQLQQGTKGHTNSNWLGYKDEFKTLRAKLSIQWLKRYRALPFHTLDTLFNIAASFADRGDLVEIIHERCAEFLFFWPNESEDEELEQRRKFWFLRALYFLNETPKPYWDWLKADRSTVLALYGRSGRGNSIDYPDWPTLSSEKIENVLDAFIGAWPKVKLKSGSSSEDSDEENAYRFLTEVVWSLNSDDPDAASPVLDRLLADQRFIDIQKDLKSIRASQVRKKALRDFEPPAPHEIVNLLDHDAVITVEGLRQLVIQELRDFQKAIDGGEFNSAVVFYDEVTVEDKKSKTPVKKLRRKNENKSTERIAERLNLRLQPQGISITPEHQLKALKRSDFTATKMIGGTRRLLVTEVKGQWHDELYTAAAAQLLERYSIHPDAEQQGVYLVLWFGPDEKVAGLKNTTIANAQELKKSIENQMSTQLAAFVDVFVLDVSRN